jgi:thiol-disulfide isomerase/thioredoxin
VRIVLCLLVLAGLSVGSCGCQLFNKKGSPSGGDASLIAANTDKNKPTAPTDPLAGASPVNANRDGLITGQVIDAVGRPADAQIRWICLDGKEEEAPIAAATNQQGYFMIHGLKSGTKYKLIVQSKSGDKLLEKVKYTTAPDVNVLVQMDERFAVTPGQGDKGKKRADKGAEQPASAQLPANPGYPGQEWQQPSPSPSPSPMTNLPKTGERTRIAEGDNSAKAPVVKTNPWQGVPEAPVTLTQPTPLLQSPYSVPTGPAPVPSSVRVGKRIEDFALNDISLTPWQLKKDRRGKLVLLDIWRTSCAPCLQSIPTMRVLQDKYGPQGLEIVAVAYEESGSPLEQATKVTKVAQYYQTNYLLLLGGGAKCPLKRDLEVRYLPTMVLLDESGNMIWRHEGTLERDQIDDLEFTIRRRLAGN